MSTTSSPKPDLKQPALNEDILTLLFEIRMELRVLNTLIAETLNAQSDPDDLRQDPFYNGSDPADTNSPGVSTR